MRKAILFASHERGGGTVNWDTGELTAGDDPLMTLAALLKSAIGRR